MSVKCKKIEPDNEINKLLYETYTSDIRTGYTEAGEENTVMPLYYEVIANDIDNFEVYDSDIIVTSHPKAGTTWTQEMVWMIANDVDFEAGKLILDERYPFLELKSVFDYRDKPEIALPDFMDSVNFIANMKTRPRFIKSHLPWSLLPRQIRENKKKPKIIHVYRNPKDVCVSYYHHSIFLEGYVGNFEQYYKLFLAGKSNINTKLNVLVTWGPFWKNFLGYWERRNQDNVLFITYEDMKQDLEMVIKKVAKFLGKEVDASKMPALVHHLSFESMKNNKSVNKSFLEDQSKRRNQPGCFMRAGVVGSYKKDMTADVIKKFDEWIEENRKGTDFPL